jgi:predicted aspartyl protease
MKLVLLSLGLAGAALSVSPSQSQGSPPAPPAAAPGEVPSGEGETVLGYDTDFYQRMTVPVSIDGQGPYRFVVDTGAERTVIARELARQLELGEGRKARMHSMSEVSDVTTVIIPELEVGGKQVLQIHAPALERRHLGAEGMLGVDSLKTQRVSFDFVRQQMTVTPSRKREEKWAKDAIVVSARSRFGHLVLVDADVDGQKVWVIIDTGSQATIGNSALRRKLEQKRRLGLTRPVQMTSVTGGKIMAEQTLTKKIRIGGMDIRQMPIAFADVHPFRKLDLMDRPALLLGMDALMLFDRVSVDFVKREVRVLSPGRSDRRGDTRFAFRQRGLTPG